MHITKFEIDNFRSLKSISIKHLLPVSIFHGPNNCGKSNILAAIESVLKPKYSADAPTVSPGEEQKVSRQKSPFYKGRLDNFGDNFYFNNQQPIRFLLTILFEDGELEVHKAIIEAISPTVPKKEAINFKKLCLGDDHPKAINVKGEFRYLGEQTCEIITQRVDCNGKYVLYVNEETVEFVPSLSNSKKFDLDARVAFFEDLMARLTGAFQLLHTDRFLAEEKLFAQQPGDHPLKPESFKQFLFLACHSQNEAQGIQDNK